MASKAELALILSLVDEVTKTARGIKGELADVGKTGKGLKGTLATVGKSLGALGKVAIVGGIGAATAAVAALATTIGPASDLAETVSKVGVVFGDQSDQIMAFGKTAATSMGMTTEAALAAAGTYGNLFRSMGMTNDASAGMSTGLVTLAADLASFNNMDPTEALDKLRAGLTGESEPLKSLGVNINAAMIKTKAMEMGLVDVGGELTAAAKASASYALIMEQTTLAQGDFARTSDGLANQQRILAATMGDLKATVGTAVLPVMQSLMGVFTNLLKSDKVQALITSITDGLASFGKRVSEIIDLLAGGDIQGAMVAIFGEEKAGAILAMAAKVGEFIDKIGGMEIVLKTLAIIVGGILVGAFVAWAIAAWAAVAPLLPIYAAIAAIIAIVALAVAAWENDWGGIRTFIINLWTNTLQPIFNTMVEWIKVNIPVALAFLAEFWKTTLLPAIKTVAAWITDTLVPILATIVEWLKVNIPIALTALAKFWEEKLLPAIKTVWAFIKDSVIPLLTALVEGAFAALKLTITALAGLWQNVLLPAIKAIVTWLGEKLGPVVEKVTGFFGKASDSLGGLSGAFEKVTGWISNMKDKISNLTLPSWLTPGSPTPLEIAMLGLGESIVGVVAGFESFAGSLDSTGVEQMGAGVEGITGSLGGLADAVRDINTVLSLGDGLDLTALVPSGSETFEQDVTKRFDQIEFVGSRAVGWIARISEFWRKALVDMAPVAANITAVLGMGGGADLDKLTASSSDTFESDVDTRFRQLEYVGSKGVSWIQRIDAFWRKALESMPAVVESVKAVLTLGGAADLEQLLPSSSMTFESDVDTRFKQLEYVGARSVNWVSRISDYWREALVAMTPVVEDVKAVLSLGGAAELDKLIPSASDTFESDVDKHFSQLEYVGSVIVKWISRISEPWRVALAEMGPVAENIKKVFSVAQIDTSVTASGESFIPRLIAHLNALIEGTPLVKQALDIIKRQWADLDALAEDAKLSELVTKFFGVLDLSKTFEDMQVIKPLKEGERRTALSNVIANFITQLKAGAPMLRDGLAEVEAMFGGALDKSVLIAEKIGTIFKAIADAIKAGIEATTQEDWSLAKLLSVVAELEIAAGAIGGLQLPSLNTGVGGGAGLIGGTSTTDTATTGSSDIAAVVRDAIMEGIRGSELAITLQLDQDAQARKEFSARLGKLERASTTMVTNWEIG